MLKIKKFFEKDPQFKGTPKVLIGGSFISFMILTKKTHHNFKNILGRKVMLFANSCSVKAADFGDKLPQAALKNLNIKIISCSHKGRFTETDCLQAAVQGGNEEGYYVATMEEADIDSLQQLDKVPIVCWDGTQFVLKKPSEHQQDLAENEAAPGHGRHHGRPHGGRYAGIGRDQRAGGRAL